MKNNGRLYFLTVIIPIVISCNDSKTNTETKTDSTTLEIKDSSDKKFNPAGEQKNSDTYNPKATATDTIYKHNDSIPKE